MAEGYGAATGRGRAGAEVVYSPAMLLLMGVVGVSFLGLGFVMPLRALYARDVGASSAEVGLMASAFLLTSFVAAPFVGWLADRFGYVTLLWTGLLFHAILVVSYIPVHSPAILIGLRGLEGVAAAAILPPARALVNSIAPRDRQAESLGLLSASQMGGMLAGPAVGSFMASQLGYTPSFVVAGAGMAIGAVACPILLARHEARSTRDDAYVALFSGALNRSLVFAYALKAAIMLPNGALMAIWSIYMQDRGASLLLIGLSYTTFALPMLVLSPLAGRVSDRHGRYWPLVWGLLALAIIYGAYGLELDPWLIVALSAVEGLVAPFSSAALDGLLADRTSASIRGRAQANYSAAGTAGSFVGATASGLLYALAPGAPFVAVGALYVVIALTLLLPWVSRLFATGQRFAQGG